MTPQSGCEPNNTVVYLGDHVGSNEQGIILHADGNTTAAPWKCTKKDGVVAAGTSVVGASPVHYGRISIVLQTAASGGVSSERYTLIEYFRLHLLSAHGLGVIA